MSAAGWPFPPAPALRPASANFQAFSAAMQACADEARTLSWTIRRHDRHAAIDDAADQLRAGIKRDCEVLRRSVAQRFRWAAFAAAKHNSRPL